MLRPGSVEEVREGRMNRHLVILDADDWQRIARVLAGGTIEDEERDA